MRPAFLVVSILSLAAACSGKSTIDCENDSDCLQGGIGGVCHASPSSDERWCAFPDHGCAGTSERWGVASGDGLAGECRRAEPTDAGVGPDSGAPDAAPPTAFAFRFGGVTDESIVTTARDSDGTVFALVPFEGTVMVAGQTFTSKGASDFLVAHLTNAGDPLWIERFGGEQEDEPTKLVLTPDHSVVVLGTFWGTTDLGGGQLLSDGATDYFILKVSGAGSFTWARRYGSSHVESAADIAVNGAGDLFVTGSFSGLLDLGGGVYLQTTDASDDLFLVRYSGSDGTPQWAERLGDSANEIAHSISCAGPNVAISGEGIGVINLGHGPVSVSHGSSFMASYSAATGIYNWSHIVSWEGSLAPVQLTAPQLLSDNSMAVCARAYGDIDFGSGTTGTGGQKELLLRYANTGELIWSRSFDMGTQSLFCDALAVDPEDHIFFAGQLDEPTTFGPDTLTPTPGAIDLFVAEYTKEGEAVGGLALSGPSMKSVTSLSAGPVVVVSGTFSSTLSAGADVLTSTGGVDSFVVGRVPPLH
jgi:hypothetical protein